MKDETLFHLLAQISEVGERYEQLARETGENFNIFRLLKVETKEVRLHSSLLAELLSPQGTHGQGDLFLRLFLSSLTRSEIPATPFLVQSATVEVEKYTGILNEDCTGGGRIDIILTDLAGKRIIIENKIYAQDQPKQLVRYRNYDKDALLLYLTLDGSNASAVSKGKLHVGKDYYLISYHKTILRWLRACEKEVLLPIVKETLRQYRILIEQLTRQSSSDQMNKEIKNILYQDESSFISAQRIYESYPVLVKEIEGKFWEEIKSQCPKEIILVNDQHEVSCDVGEDPLFYFGFIVDKANASFSAENFAHLSSILKEINPDFKSSDRLPDYFWPGWIGSRYMSSFRELEPGEIYRLANDSYREQFVAKLMSEFGEYIEAFESRILRNATCTPTTGQVHR